MSLSLQYSDDETSAIKKRYYYADDFTTAEGIRARAKMIDHNLVEKSNIMELPRRSLWIVRGYQRLWYDQITTRCKVFQPKARSIPDLQYIPIIDRDEVGGIPIGTKGSAFAHLSMAEWEEMRPPARWNAIGPILFNDWTSEHEISDAEYDSSSMAWVSFRDYLRQFIRTTFFHHLPWNFGFILDGRNDHTKRFLVYRHVVEISVYTYELFVPVLGEDGPLCGFVLGENWLTSIPTDEWTRKSHAQRFNCMATFIIEGFSQTMTIDDFPLEEAESVSLKDFVERGYFTEPKHYRFQAGGPENLGRPVENRDTIDCGIEIRIGDDEPINDLFGEISVYEPPVPDYHTEDDGSYYLESKDIFNLEWKARANREEKFNEYNIELRSDEIRGKQGDGNCGNRLSKALPDEDTDMMEMDAEDEDTELKNPQGRDSLDEDADDEDDDDDDDEYEDEDEEDDEDDEEGKNGKRGVKEDDNDDMDFESVDGDEDDDEDEDDEDEQKESEEKDDDATTARGNTTGDLGIATISLGSPKKRTKTPVRKESAVKVHTIGTINRLVKLYCSFQYKVEPSSSPFVLMDDAIRTFFEKLQEADQDACLLPFDTVDYEEPVILNPPSLPVIGKLKPYFPSMYPNYQGGPIFTQIHLGLNRPFAQVKASMSSWLMEVGWGLYEKDLQYPRTENICWLMYGSQKMDREHLKEQCQLLSKMDWGIRWMTIPGSQPTVDGKRVRAFIISVPAHHAQEAEVYVCKWWLQHTKDPSEQKYPAQLRLRMVPMFDDITNTASTARAENLVARHDSFCKAINTGRNKFFCEIPGPMGLHARIKGHHTTPYKVIMNLKSAGGRQLFMSVAKTYGRATITITWSNVVSVQAKMMAKKGLIPYFVHLYGDQHAALLFPGEAAAYFTRMCRHKWDSTKQWIDTMADRVLAKDEEDGFGYVDMYDPDGTLGEQLKGQNLQEEPENPYAYGVDAQSKDSKRTEGGTMTKTGNSDRDSTINTDNTTTQEVLLGLQSSAVQGSGGIPSQININYSEQAQDTIKMQGWNLTKLNQRVQTLKDHVKELNEKEATSKKTSAKKPKGSPKQDQKQPGISKKPTKQIRKRRKRTKSSKQTTDTSRKADDEPAVASPSTPGTGNH